MPSLSQTTKWFDKSKSLKVGEVVYLVESANWTCGVVDEVIMSGDARIRYKEGMMMQSLAKVLRDDKMFGYGCLGLTPIVSECNRVCLTNSHSSSI